MAGTSLRRFLALGIAVFAWTGYPTPAPSCPFCSMQGQTLIGDINQASMVLFGTLTNAKLDASGDLGQGSTDLVIEAVIKKHEILGDKKVITLPRYVPTDKNSNVKFLVFCDVFKGKIDPYRGVQVQADSDIVKYLQGALAVKDKPIGPRLRYYFDYLDNKDVEISTDAYKEFANADYKDYRDMAKSLPADKIANWLEDPNTPAFRYGLYASMLGHCGKAEARRAAARHVRRPAETGEHRRRRHSRRLYDAAAERGLAVYREHPERSLEGIHAPLRCLAGGAFLLGFATGPVG